MFEMLIGNNQGHIEYLTGTLASFDRLDSHMVIFGDYLYAFGAHPTSGLTYKITIVNRVTGELRVIDSPVEIPYRAGCTQNGNEVFFYQGYNSIKDSNDLLRFKLNGFSVEYLGKVTTGLVGNSNPIYFHQGKLIHIEIWAEANWINNNNTIVPYNGARTRLSGHSLGRHSRIFKHMDSIYAHGGLTSNGEVSKGIYEYVEGNLIHKVDIPEGRGGYGTFTMDNELYFIGGVKEYNSSTTGVLFTGDELIQKINLETGNVENYLGFGRPPTANWCTSTYMNDILYYGTRRELLAYNRLPM